MMGHINEYWELVKLFFWELNLWIYTNFIEIALLQYPFI